MEARNVRGAPEPLEASTPRNAGAEAFEWVGVPMQSISQDSHDRPAQEEKEKPEEGGRERRE